jgi:hypothetical protein
MLAVLVVLSIPFQEIVYLQQLQQAFFLLGQPLLFGVFHQNYVLRLNN